MEIKGKRPLRAELKLPLKARFGPYFMVLVLDQILG